MGETQTGGEGVWTPFNPRTFSPMHTDTRQRGAQLLLLLLRSPGTPGRTHATSHPIAGEQVPSILVSRGTTLPLLATF